MPLIKSASKAAVSKNVKILMSESRPQKQAVAIALDIQNRAKGAPHRKGRQHQSKHADST